jgi:hypothetical protein
VAGADLMQIASPAVSAGLFVLITRRAGVLETGRPGR